MRLSFDWLRDHVDVGDLSPERVGELLTLHVAEVERVENPGGGWPGVIVGLVREVRPHPDADKLRLVTVETGTSTVEVVCGAPNVAAGQKICYAPEGTTLPGGLQLKRRKIRGVESRGMVLSLRELGLGEDHDGILVLDPSAETGVPARDVLPGGAVFEISNTAITTRPDLWGHYGFARELAAVLETPLRPMALGDAFPEGRPGVEVEVDVQAPDLCPRYLGWVIGGVLIGPSPDWLRQRLEAVGQRSINNVVDLTNYIQLECGQPLHAFDRRQIEAGKIVVRRARPGEKVVTLDGAERTLPPDACVIADPARAVAIAGVMGLANSEVLPDTREIILEVANFDMKSVRATAQALSLRTESAVRFEKGLDVEGVPGAARRFLHLLRRCCPEAHPLGAPRDVRVLSAPPPRIELASGWISRRLGTEIPADRIDAILRSLGFGVERDERALRVTVPSWRAGRDVSIPEDLLEEVGRVHGYDRIAPEPLLGRLDPVPEEPERAGRRRARHALSHEAGMTEIHTYPFVTARDCERTAVEAGTLAVANAEQQGLDLLATSLHPNLLRALENNLKYRDEVALYVVGPVFRRGDGKGLPEEKERIALAVARRAGAHPVYELKGALETLLERFRLGSARLEQAEGPPWLHPGRAARIGRGREHFAWFGEIHPRVRHAWGIDAQVALGEVDLDAVRGAVAADPRMSPVSRYPTVAYDVAIVADRRTPAMEIEAALRTSDPRLVRDVRLFDVYEGKNLPAGKRSLAFALTFGSLEATLGPADVESLREKVQRVVARRGWTFRT